MRVLVVDDEPLARERLTTLLSDTEGVELVGEAGNGREAIEQVRECHPELVFMDIRMPVMDGLEAAHHLRLLEPAPRLIFCTAFDQHALEAFDANAIDYLVKPVRADRLSEALDKARLVRPEDIQTVALTETRSHLCARVRGNLELISLDDVICLHAEHKYVTVIYNEGEVLIEEPLKALEDEFSDRFLRVHRNALVSLTAVAGLEKAEGQMVVRLHGTDRRLEVSRRNLPHVRKIIKAL
ncbi:MAG: LytR/AlgR family response regulator transcription factor [Lysobacterales bacterium]